MNNSQRELVGNSSMSSIGEVAREKTISNSKLHGFNNSQRNFADSSTLSFNGEFAVGGLKVSQRNPAYRAGPNGSQINLLDTIRISSIRAVHNGPNINDRSTLPEVRNTLLGPNVGQRNDKEGAPAQKNLGVVIAPL